MSAERKGGGRGGGLKKTTQAGDYRPIFPLSEFQSVFLSYCSLIEFVGRKSGLGVEEQRGAGEELSAPLSALECRLRAGALA